MHALDADLDFRATTFIRECDGVLTTSCKAFHDNAAGCNANDFRVTKAGCACGCTGFALATSAATGRRSTAVHVSVTVSNDRTHAITANPQFHVLRMGRCSHNEARRCHRNGHASNLDHLEHIFLLGALRWHTSISRGNNADVSCLFLGTKKETPDR
jgi:hypothetical protein